MMGYVDSHFHMWDLQRYIYPWPTKDQEVLFRNFSIQDHAQSRQGTGVEYGVFVQVLNNTPAEADWVLELARKHTFIKGVVGGLDLTSSQLSAKLDALCKDPLFVGARHILDFEEETWLSRDDVQKGLAELELRGLTYDLLLRPHLLKYVPSIAEKFPNLRMVIDHIAKPFIKTGVINGWKEEMAEIAKYTNIYCKVSGLIPEADLDNWSVDDFKPYIKHVFDIFGEDRCMFGSDWPVSLTGNADFKDVFKLAEDLVDYCGLSPEAKEKFFRHNAIKFYNLKIE